MILIGVNTVRKKEIDRIHESIIKTNTVAATVQKMQEEREILLQELLKLRRAIILHRSESLDIEGTIPYTENQRKQDESNNILWQHVVDPPAQVKISHCETCNHILYSSDEDEQKPFCFSCYNEKKRS